MPHAKIATHQAIFTLEQLHAELGGKILDNKAEAKRLAAAMVHVEAVLKMLQPGYDVRPIAVRRRKPNPYFKRGTVWRSVLDVLRAAERPMTTAEVTGAMLKAKAVQAPARKAIANLDGAVRAALRQHPDQVVLVLNDGKSGQWRLR
jgi:hypothetical protein